MQTRKFRNSLNLYCHQIIWCILFICLSWQAKAQDEKMYNPEHENKLYYFGIAIGINTAQYKIAHSNYFTQYDSIKNITPYWKPGFNVGIVGNLRLSRFVDFRTIPMFMIREQQIKFKLFNDSTYTHGVESVLFNMPFEFKFKSDRQTNFRFYVLAGGKIDYDFNANARSKRKDEILKFKAFDYGYNIGLGFDLYYPNFIFSPEIKLSNGLGNVLQQGSQEPINKALSRLSTRMVFITFHIQG